MPWLPLVQSLYPNFMSDFSLQDVKAMVLCLSLEEDEVK